MIQTSMRVPIVSELRGLTEAVSNAADRTFPAEEEAADNYEAFAGTLGAFTLVFADVTYRVIETGSSITCTNALLALGATILSSAGAAFFYDKSRESRQQS